MPDQDLSRLGRVPLWAWLVIAVVIIGVIASALGAGGDDDGGGSGETGGKYDQTWTTSYQATTCEQWLNQMSPQQRFAGAADMLTGARNKGDGGTGVPGDDLVNEFKREVDNACTDPTASLATVGAEVYLAGRSMFRP